MSLRYEQYRALRMTRDFMYSLCYPSETPRVPSAVRKQALRCMRHYPFLKADGEPMFSKDDFTDPQYAQRRECLTK